MSSEFRGSREQEGEEVKLVGRGETGARAVLAAVLTIALAGCTPGGSEGMKQGRGAVPGSADGICPVLTGSTLPQLTLATVDGEPFDVNAAVAEKPAVLIFYRGGWCPFCNTQLGQLRGIQGELEQLGYQVIAVSADRPGKLKESIREQEIDYLLLSDSSMAGSKAMGIAFEVDDGTLVRYSEYGIDLEEASGEKHHLLPVPSAFIVGTDGVIKFQYVNPDYKVRVESELLLLAARVALGDTSQSD